MESRSFGSFLGQTLTRRSHAFWSIFRARQQSSSTRALLVVAWIAQFVCHSIEGKRPSFLTDMEYLLIGPIWTLRKLYTRRGWGT